MWSIFSFLSVFFSITNWVTLRTIKWPIWSDFNQDPTIIEGNRSIFNTISLVNDYLWFAIWLACFWFMIWNGYQLIMARGDEKQMKTATNSITWCAVWIVVCVLARIIVNLAVKLFA